jgi:hypothetical protein
MTKEVMKQALEKIANVIAMDYEYQIWAREALGQSKQEQDEPKEWVSLTDEDMEFLFPFGKSAWLTETLKIFEAKLKERNT